jgi:putative SOS response-associated peptidase YedK
MCGRYATTRTAADLSALFEALDVSAERVVVDYDGAPTDPVPVVRMSASHGGRVIDVARWGLVPAWATDRRSGARMINARAETIETTRAYARPFAMRRCLVPATGWYEFTPLADRRGKQPYFMTPRDGGPVAFGGIWSVWGDAEDRLLTCSIVTTAAVGELTAVHDRMPLILDRDRWEAWLTAVTGLSDLLAPPTAAAVAALEIRAVGTAVGDVRNDGPGLVEPVPGYPAAGDASHAPASRPADLTLF